MQTKHSHRLNIKLARQTQKLRKQKKGYWTIAKLLSEQEKRKIWIASVIRWSRYKLD